LVADNEKNEARNGSPDEDHQQFNQPTYRPTRVTCETDASEQDPEPWNTEAERSTALGALAGSQWGHRTIITYSNELYVFNRSSY
jgi:hypothetical protein